MSLICSFASFAGHRFVNLGAIGLGPNKEILSNEPVDPPVEETYKTLADMDSSVQRPPPRGRTARGGGSCKVSFTSRGAGRSGPIRPRC